MKTLKYYRSRCIACTICASQAPNIFVMNSADGKADLLDGQQDSKCESRIIWPDELEHLNSIVKLCSVKAIQIV